MVECMLVLLGATPEGKKELPADSIWLRQLEVNGEDGLVFRLLQASNVRSPFAARHIPFSDVMCDAFPVTPLPKGRTGSG